MYASLYLLDTNVFFTLDINLFLQFIIVDSLTGNRMELRSEHVDNGTSSGRLTFLSNIQDQKSCRYVAVRYSKIHLIGFFILYKSPGVRVTLSNRLNNIFLTSNLGEVLKSLGEC